MNEEKSGKTYRDYSCLQTPKRTHAGEKDYECKECDKVWGCYSFLLNTHTQGLTQKRPCEGKNVVKLSLLSFQIHERNLSGEKLSAKKKVVMHSFIPVTLEYIKEHTGENQMNVNISKAFTCHKTIWRHRRVHTVETLYEYSQCGKAFNSRFFWRYESAHWIKSLECEQCVKDFNGSYPSLQVKTFTKTNINGVSWESFMEIKPCIIFQKTFHRKEFLLNL